MLYIATKVVLVPALKYSKGTVVPSEQILQLRNRDSNTALKLSFVIAQVLSRVIRTGEGSGA
jgi:hypothetical protein